MYGVVGGETERGWCQPDAVLDCSRWATGKRNVYGSLIHNLKKGRGGVLLKRVIALWHERVKCLTHTLHYDTTEVYHEVRE